MNTIHRNVIIEAENRLLEAIKKSDVNANMLHDDLLFITPDGQTITKLMDMDSHRAGTMIVEEILPTIELINLIENTAIVVIVYQSKGNVRESNRW